MKLTREQYQNLEHYLVEFRAKLNQTSMKEDAIPLFKEAVIELDKYGLLPRGMNVDAAQRLVTGDNHYARVFKFLENIYRGNSGQFAENENRNCLISGVTTRTYPEGPVVMFEESRPIPIIGNLLWFWCFFWSRINPIPILTRINIGYWDDEFGVGATYYYSDGWVISNGVNGQKSFNGTIRGDLPLQGTRYMCRPPNTRRNLYPAITGFTGIMIYTAKNETRSYFGFALWMKINQID